MAVRMGTESPDGVQLWPELDPAGPPRRLRSGRIDDILTCPVPGTLLSTATPRRPWPSPRDDSALKRSSPGGRTGALSARPSSH